MLLGNALSSRGAGILPYSSGGRRLGAHGQEPHAAFALEAASFRRARGFYVAEDGTAVYLVSRVVAHREFGRCSYGGARGG